MDKTKIPTITITIDATEDEPAREVEVYKWLTQDENDEYQMTLIGDVDVSGNADGKFTATTFNAIKARNYKLKAMLKSPAWQEMSVWSPEQRESLMDKVSDLSEKKKQSK